jgi:hypothetical protein
MTNARVILLALLLLGGMIVSPISAAEYSSTLLPQANTTSYYGENVLSWSHDADQLGQKVALIYFTVPAGSTVDFTLYYGNQSSVSGSMANTPIGVWTVMGGYTLASVEINGVTDSYAYWDLNQFYDIEVTGYARQSNNTEVTGFLVSSDAYGIGDNDLASFFAVPDLQRNLIYKIEATGTQPFKIEVVDAPVRDVAENVAHTPLEGLNDWLNVAMQVGGAVKDFILSIFWLIKFFFIDNLLLIIALWISVSMAYSAMSTRDIFQFYRKFFKLQKALLDFIVSLWNTLVQIVGTMVQIFVKWL